MSCSTTVTDLMVAEVVLL